jgi:hypothetical protein
MDTSIVGQIAALRRMSVTELRQEWERLYSEDARSRNRDHLWRRLAWRVQEIRYGSLSDGALKRIDELAPAISLDRPAVTARGTDPASSVERSRPRDPRLPAPGTVISKTYKGSELRVTVRDDGYEFEGEMFPSLTAVAKHVTGCKSINGKLFFGLTQRNRR